MTRFALALFTCGCVSSGIELESGAQQQDVLHLPGPQRAWDAGEAEDVARPADTGPTEPDAGPPPDATGPADVFRATDADVRDARVGSPLPEPDAGPLECPAGFFDANGDRDDGCERGCGVVRSRLLGQGPADPPPRLAVDGPRWAVLRATAEGLLLATHRGGFLVPGSEAARLASTDVAASPGGWLVAYELLDEDGLVHRLRLVLFSDDGHLVFTRTTDHVSAGRLALAVQVEQATAALAYTTGDRELELLSFELADPAALDRRPLARRVQVSPDVRPAIVQTEAGFGVVAATGDALFFVEAATGDAPERRFQLALRAPPVEVAAAIAVDGLGVSWRHSDGGQGFSVLDRDPPRLWGPISRETREGVTFRHPAVLATSAGFAALATRDDSETVELRAHLFWPDGAHAAGPVTLVRRGPYAIQARQGRATFLREGGEAHAIALDCR